MNPVRAALTGVLSFLLFVCLAIFGVAFFLQSTFLNPDFIAAEVEKLDISAIADDILDESIIQEEYLSSDFITEPEFIRSALTTIINDQEEWIRGEADRVIDRTYGFLLQETDELNVTVRLDTLKENLRDSLWEIMMAEPDKWLPDVVEYITLPYIRDNLEDYLAAIPAQFRPPAEGIEGYLMGIVSDATAGGIGPMTTELLNVLVRPVFNDYYDKYTAQIPDSVVLEDEIPVDVMEQLDNARTYISWFRAGFYILIGIMVLLIAGIVLINRNVKDITRSLGINLIIFGALELAGVIFTRSLEITGFISELPPSLEAWLAVFIHDLLLPLQWFSLGVLITGAVLLAVSFLYRPQKAEE